MLVLSRRVGESIRIGDDIELVVTSVKGGRVRLGIRAPRDVSIQRSELMEADRPEHSGPVSNEDVNGSDCGPTSAGSDEGVRQQKREARRCLSDSKAGGAPHAMRV